MGGGGGPSEGTDRPGAKPTSGRREWGAGGVRETPGGASSLPGFTSPTLGAWALTFLPAPGLPRRSLGTPRVARGRGWGPERMCAIYPLVHRARAAVWIPRTLLAGVRFLVLGDMFRNRWAFLGEGEEWEPGQGSWTGVLFLLGTFVWKRGPEVQFCKPTGLSKQSEPQQNPRHPILAGTGPPCKPFQLVQLE